MPGDGMGTAVLGDVRGTVPPPGQMYGAVRRGKFAQGVRMEKEEPMG